MKPNISLINAVFRIACGLTIMSAASAKFTKKPWCRMHLFYIFMGAMKAGSGILRFCPVTYMLQNSASGHNEQEHQDS
ncbi:YgaP family membrane protein [Bacillus vallismortis]|uniref:YgaP family membrane protein n=1 Tax=Bacillus vallismortis TaxID=72361 RepID=UPI00374D937C